MKNTIGKMVLLAVGMMFMFMGQVQAFDYMADVDAVSGNPYKAYTLYHGMPWSEVKQNFIGLPGWTRYQDEIDSDMLLIKNGGVNDVVKECIWIQYFPENFLKVGIRRYEISFFTNSPNIAEKIYERLEKNIENKLGNADNGDYEGDSEKKLMFRQWVPPLEGYIDIYSPIMVGIVHRRDAMHQYYISESKGLLQINAKYQVSIIRYVYDRGRGKGYFGLPINPGMEREAIEFYMTRNLKSKSTEKVFLTIK